VQLCEWFVSVQPASLFGLLAVFFLKRKQEELLFKTHPLLSKIDKDGS